MVVTKFVCIITINYNVYCVSVFVSYLISTIEAGIFSIDVGIIFTNISSSSEGVFF